MSRKVQSFAGDRLRNTLDLIEHASRLDDGMQPSGDPCLYPYEFQPAFGKGLVGKKRIHTFPPRFTWRVMATRAASICLEVT